MERTAPLSTAAGFSGPDKLLQPGQIVLPEQGYSAVVLRFSKVLKLEDAR
jgi:hypothetical protein